jgi:acetoacetate decarboxylase
MVQLRARCPALTLSFCVDLPIPATKMVRYFREDIPVRGAWQGPCALEPTHHALAPVAWLPVRDILADAPILSRPALGPGTAVHAYLDKQRKSS